MPISEKDREFMEQVAAYFRSTRSPLEPNGSIRMTAVKFGLNRNKIRKILITMGEWESPITKDAIALREQGLSIKEIAETLGVSTATVSTALPYADKIDNSLDPSAHASDVRDYRAYEREQVKKQAARNAKKKKKTANAWDEEKTSQPTQTGKEWQKDIKMSYTETYHRPHRYTWADMDEIRKTLEEEITEDSPEEVKMLLAVLDSMEKRNEDEEHELEELWAKKKLSKKEKDRQILLRFKTGRFPGALNDRNRTILESIAGDRLPPEPRDVIRLHMELYAAYPDEETVEVLRKYGKLTYGNCISRDIIAPGDIPLYALHYVIQRAFGWQNSHLRQFELPEERFRALTNGNTSFWSLMVGVLFRSPLMDEDDEFWADDYKGGSFKNWLRKKYTGPYLSQCHGEGLISCQDDMMELDMDEEYYLLYAGSYNPETRKYDGEEYLAEVMPVYDHEGKKIQKPKPWFGDNVPHRVEAVTLDKVPSEGLKYIFDRNPKALIERLPLRSVLAAGLFELPERASAEERKYLDGVIVQTGEELYQAIEKYYEGILREQIDSPEIQVEPVPVTDTLLYNYDFGDDWKIRITASENCTDLVESGRISQAELDRANVKCREVYRPVLIAKDGEMLIDDVGGLYGFLDFLQKINPDMGSKDPYEKERAKQEKKEYLAWAKGQGWHKEKTTDFNLL